MESSHLWEVPKPMEGPLPFAGEVSYPTVWQGEVTTEPPEAEVYRPWATRFQVTPPKAPPGTSRKEFRAGYKEFAEANIHHPVAPNSIDRAAESATIFVFALAALGTVVGAGLSMERLQGAAHPEKHMLGLAASLSLPWVLAMGWLVHVAIRHFEQPMRVRDRQTWHCSVAIWYLLIVPPLTAINIMVQALWMSGAHRPPAKQAPMGRMMPGAAASPWTFAGRSMKGVEGPDEAPNKLVQLLVRSATRYVLLGLEVAAALFGAVLAASCDQLCEPEVWWAIVSLVAATSAVMLAAPVVMGCGYIVATLGGFKAAKGDPQGEEEGLVAAVESLWDEDEEEEDRLQFR